MPPDVRLSFSASSAAAEDANTQIAASLRTVERQEAISQAAEKRHQDNVAAVAACELRYAAAAEAARVAAIWNDDIDTRLDHLAKYAAAVAVRLDAHGSQGT